MQRMNRFREPAFVRLINGSSKPNHEAKIDMKIIGDKKISRMNSKK
jgi:hypothetical protein